MNYKIETQQFEGPLDLLLHLIKKSNIDIKDINIEEITKQYLNYINLMVYGWLKNTMNSFFSMFVRNGVARLMSTRRGT